MKKFSIFIFLFLLMIFTACGETNSVESPANKDFNSKGFNMKIFINGKTFNATLEDNESTREFVKRLPLEITMTELNGNEKYYKFSEQFPSNDRNVGTIHNGDLMLFNASYFVLFYKNFSTNYSYTRLGRIDNVDDLENIVGTSNIKVRIEK